jgi:segregation and condensation protein B
VNNLPEELQAAPLEEVAPAAGPSPAEAIKSAVEAIIYAADEPATLDQIAKALGVEKPVARAALDLLVASSQTDERGIEVRKVAGGWKFYTKPQHHDVVRRFIKSLQPPIRLTMPALETLAVIAYKQPVTAPEIMEIRGVQGVGVLKTLLDRKLIAESGRKNVVGKPILYKTTKDFLVQFGLKDLTELPTLKEFEELGRLEIADETLAEPAVEVVEPIAEAAAPGMESEKPAENG